LAGSVVDVLNDALESRRDQSLLLSSSRIVKRIRFQRVFIQYSSAIWFSTSAQRQIKLRQAAIEVVGSTAPETYPKGI
jgi:hypothetical protein